MSGLTLAQLGFLLALFLAIFGIGVAAIRPMLRSRVRRRLHAIITPGTKAADVNAADLSAASRDETGRPDTPEARWLKSIAKIARPLANLSLPEDGWEQSELRLRFMNAGIRSPYATPIFFGVKTLSAAVLPIAFGLVKLVTLSRLAPNHTLFLMALLSGVGYYLPNFILNQRAEARRKAIENSFPDALDLLTICVEAGLSIDAAVDRVANELGLSCPPLAEEMTLVGLELRAGASRDRALRNLALRTGVEDIESLVAMLIQSDKFGTGIAEALRVHSDLLRVKRQQRAEEAAAKLPTKLMLPMMLCIFPAVLVVAAGPAMILLGKTMKMLAK